MAREWQSAQVDALVDDQGDLRTGTVIVKELILNILDQVLTNGLYLDPAVDDEPYLRMLGGLLAMGPGGASALAVGLKHDATGGTDGLRARTPADDGDVPVGGADPTEAHHYVTKSYAAQATFFGANDAKIAFSAGALVFYENTGTAGSPVWEARAKLDLSTGDWYVEGELRAGESL